MGYSDGMGVGGHQIGSPSCKDMVKTASFFYVSISVLTGHAFLNVFRSSDLVQNRVTE